MIFISCLPVTLMLKVQHFAVALLTLFPTAYGPPCSCHIGLFCEIVVSPQTCQCFVFFFFFFPAVTADPSASNRRGARQAGATPKHGLCKQVRLHFWCVWSFTSVWRKVFVSFLVWLFNQNYKTVSASNIGHQSFWLLLIIKMPYQPITISCKQNKVTFWYKRVRPWTIPPYQCLISP